MRARIITSAAACAALLLGGLAVGSADAATPGGARAAAAGQHDSTPRAERALARVQAAFAPKPRRGALTRSGAGTTSPDGDNGADSSGRELTLLLRDLRLNLAGLSRADLATAERYLARPTDGPSDFDGFGYTAPIVDQRVNCNFDHVCVHWVTTTSDAPPNAGEMNPPWVQKTGETLEDVWGTIVTDGGYRAPLDDSAAHDPGTEGPPTPNTKKLDIYLVDSGDSGYYGYCNADFSASGSLDKPGRHQSAYCALDNDFSPLQFPSHTPLENLQVTAAHEFFHAVQFAYDYFEDRWLMEGSAAWMEDEVYDNINDNLIYARHQSPMTNPTKPLDFWSPTYWPYGSWVWWRFLSERYPGEGTSGLPLVMRKIWEHTDNADYPAKTNYSIAATKRVIAAKGGNLTRLFAAFGEANRHPAQSYSEGSSYPKVPLLKNYRLSRTRHLTPVQQAKMPHLTNFTVRFTPKSLTSKQWRLRVSIDAPPKARGSFAALTVYRRGGGFSTVPITLDGKGRGAKRVPFSTRRVRYVELTLTNAGIRYDCNEGTLLSCGGISLDNNLKTLFQAKAVR